MVAISVAFVDFSYYFARASNSNHIGWDVLDDYTVRTDDRVSTDGNARQHTVCAPSHTLLQIRTATLHWAAFNLSFGLMGCAHVAMVTLGAVITLSPMNTSGSSTSVRLKFMYT